MVHEKSGLLIPVGFDLIKTYDELIEYTMAFAARKFTFLLLIGSPGSGKTRQMKTSLTGVGHTWIDNSVSAVGLYAAVFEANNSPIVLDDTNTFLKQPEAVPLLNYIQIDADDAPGLRVVPLNYRNIIFKTDGVYAVPNTFPLSFQKISDAVLLAPDSIQRLKDSLYFLSDAGLMVVDDAGVREVGQPIDVALGALNTPTALANVQERSVGVSYRSEDLYALWVPERDGDEVTTDTAQAFVNCRKGDGFTRWGFGVRFGVIDPNGNQLVVAPTDDNRLWLERKSLTAADYYDVGDAAIPCRVAFNPFASGEPAVMKMAQQASFLFRENTCPELTAEFATEIHPTASEVPLAPDGWGDSPWGQTPWGGSVNPLVRVQPLPVEVANACQLTVGFSANVQGTKFVFLGIDIDANGDTRQSRDS